jgi:23S rRNA pseudouridine2605 synthase
MRLHRFIAQCGVTSRRKAEELILEGRVAVNGSTVRELGIKVGPGDRVDVDGEPIGQPEAVTLLLNKPKGYVTTTSDEKGRPTIMRLVPAFGPVKPVGRLDMDSEGLLLLTTDGDLASRLSHARYGIDKEYKVVVSGQPDERDLERLRRGVVIEGRRTSPCTIEPLRLDPGTSMLLFVLHEGRNRQIRRMCEAIGHPVIDLTRTRIAHLSIRGMKPGECRKLGDKDVQRLRALVGLEGSPRGK